MLKAVTTADRLSGYAKGGLTLILALLEISQSKPHWYKGCGRAQCCHPGHHHDKRCVEVRRGGIQF